MPPKKRLLILIAVVIALIAGAGIWQFYSAQMAARHSTLPKAVLKINGISLIVDVAVSEAEREKGLSGRPSLSPNEGMVFVFQTPGLNGFWMPDMHFPIDIIWLDDHLKVVYIQKNATPDSYPTVFTPSATSTYVLETVAGFTDEHSIKVGDVGEFTFATE